MKNTKGVRQVLEDVYRMGRTDQTLGVDDFATLKPKIEAKLQEIMLGMLPEEDKRAFPGIEPGQDPVRETCYKQGWNEAIKLTEQNIRGGFKNE